MKYFDVTPLTTLADIKIRRKQLAKQLHPDKGGTNNEFQEMEKEYETAKKIIEAPPPPNPPPSNPNSLFTQPFFDAIMNQAINEAVKITTNIINTKINKLKNDLNKNNPELSNILDNFFGEIKQKNDKKP